MDMDMNCAPAPAVSPSGGGGGGSGGGTDEGYRPSWYSVPPPSSLAPASETREDEMGDQHQHQYFHHDGKGFGGFRYPSGYLAAAAAAAVGGGECGVVLDGGAAVESKY